MKFRATALAVSLLLASTARAHFPTLDCVATSENQLSCLAGFSDGSATGAVVLSVHDYDETLITKVTTDSEGKAEFYMPEGEFYIIFDANHEEPAEFDYAELE